MAFTIRQLQFFIAVAEQGTVSGAAQNLSISQSSVTEAIKELEGDLGVELFERHPRGLNITHKGHQFLRHATKNWSCLIVNAMTRLKHQFSRG